jgi:chitosanase
LVATVTGGVVTHVFANPGHRPRHVRFAFAAAAGVVVAVAALATNLASRPVSQKFTVDQHLMINKLESVLLHDSDSFQYGRIVDQRDGRGYVAGLGDFSVAGGEALAVVQTYTASVPDNPLGHTYIPALRPLTEQHSAAGTGLDGYPKAWQQASADPLFRQAQDAVMNDLYFTPAKAKAEDLGITKPLGVAILYDSIIQHGDGADPDSLNVLISRTNSAAHGRPGQGVDEHTWLETFLDVRTDILTRPANSDRRESWPFTIGRVRALDSLLAHGQYALAPPLTVNPYGNVHVLELSLSDDVPTKAAPGVSVSVAPSPAPAPALTYVAPPSATARPTPMPARSKPPARIDYANFADVSGLLLNGSAASTGTSLRLTDNAQAAGSVWAKSMIDPTRSFSTSFRLSIPARGSGDGMAFVIQTQGRTALGTSGGGLGYGGHPDRPMEARIIPSVDVEFDVWDNSSDGWDPPGQEHVAVTTNGDIKNYLSWADPGHTLTGEAVGVWMEYDAAAKTLAVYVSRSASRPPSPLVTATVDIAAIVGNGPAYVGLTAGCGAFCGVQDVLNWHFQSA